MKTIFCTLLTVFILPSVSFAQGLLNKNLMTCDPKNGVETNCRITEGLVLTPIQPVESDFYVSYAMTCNRGYPNPVPSKISLKIENGNGLILNYKDSKVSSFVGTGVGPLIISDSFPKELAFRSHGSCELVLNNISVHPSASIKAVWNAELSGHTSVLAAKEALVKSLENVFALLPAYNFFQELSNNLETNLNANKVVLNLAAELSKCPTEDDCDILYRMSGNESLGLTAKEIITITKLRAILSEVSPSSPPLKLSDRLTPQALEIINKLSNDAKFYKDAEAQIKDESTKIEVLRDQIATLTAKIGS